MIIIQFCIGTVIGSFLQVINQRQLAHQSWITPRSRCDQCREPLKWYELVPIISYLSLRGRCRYCRVSIPRTTLFSELFGGLCLLQWTPTGPSTLQSLLGLGLILLANRDQTTTNLSQLWLIAAFVFALITRVFFTPPTLWTLLVVFVWAALQIVTIELPGVGLADLDVACLVLVLFSPITATWLFLIASISALLSCLIHQRNGVPFLPHLTVAYLLILYIN